jgi:murein L,D-transpeptidase YcbB/YkuD
MARCVGLAFLLWMLPAAGVWAQEWVWFPGGHPSAQAVDAVRLLAAAAEDGLRPEEYGVDTLQRALEQMVWGGFTPEEISHWDEVLTQSVVRYLHHLQGGRVPLQMGGRRYVRPIPSWNALRQKVVAAARQGQLSQLVAETAPKLPLYTQLRALVEHYRRLAERPDVVRLWSSPLPPLLDSKLEPGGRWSGLPRVVERLVILGDLPEGTAPSEVLTPEVAAGLRAFQTRHGLLADGVLGRRTLARLDVSPAQGVRQMELAMERLRWVNLDRSRVIAIYLPENILEGYRKEPDGSLSVELRMRVISGNAANTPTPLFEDEIRAIELSPYWNVPLSILRDELAPKFLKSPDVFQREGFEFVVPGQGAEPELRMDLLNEALRGRVRVRQRPGSSNPMGDIKFVMSNKEDIFLHHTALPQLFQRARRDLSHGCIRVEDPVGLAQFVLESDPAWNEDRLRSAMNQTSTTILAVRCPPRVIILYSTVRVEHGRAAFLADLYGLDGVLDQALRSAPLTVSRGDP